MCETVERLVRSQWAQVCSLVLLLFGRNGAFFASGRSRVGVFGRLVGLVGTVLLTSGPALAADEGNGYGFYASDWNCDGEDVVRLETLECSGRRCRDAFVLRRDGDLEMGKGPSFRFQLAEEYFGEAEGALLKPDYTAASEKEKDPLVVILKTSAAGATPVPVACGVAPRETRLILGKPPSKTYDLKYLDGLVAGETVEIRVYAPLTSEEQKQTAATVLVYQNALGEKIAAKKKAQLCQEGVSKILETFTPSWPGRMPVGSADTDVVDAQAALEGLECDGDPAVVGALDVLQKIRAELQTPSRAGLEKLVRDVGKKKQAAEAKGIELCQQACGLVALQKWLKRSKEGKHHRWLTSHRVPLALRGAVIAAEYGAGTVPTEYAKRGANIDLFVRRVPAGQSLSVHRGTEQLAVNALNFGKLAGKILPLFLKAVTRFPFSGCTGCFHFLGPDDLLPAAAVGVVYFRTEGTEKGRLTKLSICDDEGCEKKDPKGKPIAPKNPQTVVPVSPVPAYWKGFTFLVDGSFNVGPAKAMGDPAYDRHGEALGGQQMYALGYPDKPGRLTVSLLAAARLQLNSRRGVPIQVALATGPALYPGKVKVRFQWNIQAGLRLVDGFYLTAGVGLRESKVLRRGRDLGLSRSVEEGADPPGFSDTRDKVHALGLIGVAVDLGSLGTSAEKVVDALGGGNDAGE